MDNKASLLKTEDIEVLRDNLIKCHHKNENDSIQQVNMYIYDLTTCIDVYVIEYDDNLKLLIGIINPLKTRNSIKVKTYSIDEFKNHTVYYKYLEDCSLFQTLSNLESNEFYLLKNNLL